MARGSGYRQQRGGVLRSTDDARSWTPWPHTAAAGSPPLFHGGDLPGRPVHPRATGSLLGTAGSGTATELYAASYTGLARWKGDPATGLLTAGWSTPALTGVTLTSLAIEPNLVTNTSGTGLRVVFVTDVDGAVHRIGLTATGTLVEDHDFSSFTAATPAPGGVTELFRLGSHLYAAGIQGLAVCDNCATATGAGHWTRVLAAPQLYSVTGSTSTTTTAVVDRIRVGALDAEKVTTTDAGAFGVGSVTLTWPTSGAAPSISAATNETNFSPSAAGWPGWDVYGLPGTVWWESAPTGAAANMVGGVTFRASDLLTTPDGAVYVAGKSGVWRKAPSGTAAGSWSPAVHGLGVSFDKAVAIKPGDPSRVGVADTDWAFLGSTDSLQTVARNVAGKPDTGPFSGLGLTWAAPDPRSPVDAVAVLATGSRDCNNAGALWRSTGPVAGGAWEALASLPQNARPVAVAPDTTGQPLFVAVQGSNPNTSQCGAGRVQPGTGGVYRYTENAQGVGSWTRMPAAGGPTISHTDVHAAAFATHPGVTAYLYERPTATEPGGVWRSSRTATGWGAWQRIVALVQTDNAGSLLVDPVTPSRLWISTDRGLRYLPNAAACAPLTAATPCPVPTAVAGAAPGGPLGAAAGDSVLYMARPGTASAPPALLEVRPPSGAAAVTVIDRTDGAAGYLANAAADPDGVAVSVSGGLHRVYIATAGNGVVVAQQTAP